jgi:hypothetical protein
MSLRNARATASITGHASPSRTGASGDVKVGSSAGIDHDDGGIYCLRILGITQAIAPVLTVLTGIVAENGSQSVDEGVTFEGLAPGLISPKAILIERTDFSVLTLTVTGSSGTVVKIPPGGFFLLSIPPSTAAAVLADATLTLSCPNNTDPASVRITALGSVPSAA